MFQQLTKRVFSPLYLGIDWQAECLRLVLLPPIQSATEASALCSCLGQWAVPIPKPDALALNTHRLKTRAVVGLVQTLVLGGALYPQQLDCLLSNPLLARLPLVGQWFERHKHGAEHFERLVFVTPRIVNL